MLLFAVEGLPKTLEMSLLRAKQFEYYKFIENINTLRLGKKEILLLKQKEKKAKNLKLLQSKKDNRKDSNELMNSKSELVLNLNMKSELTLNPNAKSELVLNAIEEELNTNNDADNKSLK